MSLKSLEGPFWDGYKSEGMHFETEKILWISHEAKWSKSYFDISCFLTTAEHEIPLPKTLYLFLANHPNYAHYWFRASSNLYQLGKIQGVLSFLENISYTATTPEFNSNQVKNCLGICKLLMPDKCFLSGCCYSFVPTYCAKWFRGWGFWMKDCLSIETWLLHWNT